MDLNNNDNDEADDDEQTDQRYANHSTRNRTQRFTVRRNLQRLHNRERALEGDARVRDLFSHAAAH